MEPNIDRSMWGIIALIVAVVVGLLAKDKLYGAVSGVFSKMHSAIDSSSTGDLLGSGIIKLNLNGGSFGIEKDSILETTRNLVEGDLLNTDILKVTDSQERSFIGWYSEAYGEYIMKDTFTVVEGDTLHAVWETKFSDDITMNLKELTGNSGYENYVVIDHVKFFEKYGITGTVEEYLDHFTQVEYDGVIVYTKPNTVEAAKMLDNNKIKKDFRNLHLNPNKIYASLPIITEVEGNLYVEINKDNNEKQGNALKSISKANNAFINFKGIQFTDTEYQSLGDFENDIRMIGEFTATYNIVQNEEISLNINTFNTSAKQKIKEINIKDNYGSAYVNLKNPSNLKNLKIEDNQNIILDLDLNGFDYATNLDLIEIKNNIYVGFDRNLIDATEDPSDYVFAKKVDLLANYEGSYIGFNQIMASFGEITTNGKVKFTVDEERYGFDNHSTDKIVMYNSYSDNEFDVKVVNVDYFEVVSEHSSDKGFAARYSLLDVKKGKITTSNLSEIMVNAHRENSDIDLYINEFYGAGVVFSSDTQRRNTIIYRDAAAILPSGATDDEIYAKSVEIMKEFKVNVHNNSDRTLEYHISPYWDMPDWTSYYLNSNDSTIVKTNRND